MILDVEEIRERFRPATITTLFVGESAPHNGDFFYVGKTSMLQHMRGAVESALGEAEGDFAQRFKDYGWYLDDLVLEPVDHLKRAEREAKCKAAQESLALRISHYQPLAIVSLLRRIEPIVAGAAKAAGSGAICHAVRFPGMGHQVRFKAEMAALIPSLPKCGAGITPPFST